MALIRKVQVTINSLWERLPAAIYWSIRRPLSRLEAAPTFILLVINYFFEIF